MLCTVTMTLPEGEAIPHSRTQLQTEGCYICFATELLIEAKIVA